MKTSGFDSFAPLLLAACLLPGCVFFDVAQQNALIAKNVRLRGSLTGPTPDAGPLIALLVRWPGGEAEPEIVDHYVMAKSGSFYFVTNRPGTYSVPGFVDQNANLHFDPGEPAIRSTQANTFELVAGAYQQGITLRIGAGDRVAADAPLDIRALQARSVGECLAFRPWGARCEISAVADTGHEDGDIGEGGILNARDQDG